jgi:indolepyruvate decarboxylase
LVSDHTVGEYLLGALKELGIKEVFGIPGDMIIKFFKLLEDDKEVKLCTFSHEPAVGFAAIGSARANQRPAVACVTYGPGGLNMLNSVACAYAEKTPLVVVSGGPAMKARRRDVFLHHMVKDFDSQLKVYSEVTCESVILDDAKTAAVNISRAIHACQEYMLPVYIEIPSDVVDETIIEPSHSWRSPTIEQRIVDDAAHMILERLRVSEKPVIMLGVETDRFQLKSDIMSLALKLNIPVVSTLLARDLAPEDELNYYGTYLGDAGNPVARRLVDESDFLLLLGVILSDVNLGSRLVHSKGLEMVQCISRQVKTADQVLDGVSLTSLVKAMKSISIKRPSYFYPEKTPLLINKVCKYAKSPIVTSEIIDALNWFFSEYGEMPIISDTGDCLFTTIKMKTSTVMSSAYYATMGFAVPAAMGYAVSTGKRPLVLVGDGGFQMTGQEVCHCPRYEINPIFVIYNNTRWGMEQVFYETAEFNELVNWRYAEMADLWNGKGYVCNDCDSLYKALEDAERSKVFTLIEVVTEKEELSDELLAWIKEQKRQPLTSA